jgi:hypothetical protein
VILVGYGGFVPAKGDNMTSFFSEILLPLCILIISYGALSASGRRRPPPIKTKLVKLEKRMDIIRSDSIEDFNEIEKIREWLKKQEERKKKENNKK